MESNNVIGLDKGKAISALIRMRVLLSMVEEMRKGASREDIEAGLNKAKGLAKSMNIELKTVTANTMDEVFSQIMEETSWVDNLIDQMTASIAKGSTKDTIEKLRQLKGAKKESNLSLLERLFNESTGEKSSGD